MIPNLLLERMDGYALLRASFYHQLHRSWEVCPHSPSKDTSTAATKRALAEVAPLLQLMADRGIDEQPTGHLDSVDALGRLLEDALSRMSLLDANPKRLDERDLVERSDEAAD